MRWFLETWSKERCSIQIAGFHGCEMHDLKLNVPVPPKTSLE